MRTTSCTDHCSTRMMLLDLACQNRGKPLGLELRLPLVEIEEEGARVTPADNIIEPDPPWRLAPVSARRPRGRVGRNTGKDSQSPLNPTPRPASKEQRAKSKEQSGKELKLGQQQEGRASRWPASAWPGQARDQATQAIDWFAGTRLTQVDWVWPTSSRYGRRARLAVAL
jgi:hypothetical protein